MMKSLIVCLLFIAALNVFAETEAEGQAGKKNIEKLSEQSVLKQKKWLKLLIIKRLKYDDPQKYNEMLRLKREDPEAFNSELDRMTEEQYKKAEDERKKLENLIDSYLKKPDDENKEKLRKALTEQYEQRLNAAEKRLKQLKVLVKRTEVLYDKLRKNKNKEIENQIQRILSAKKHKDSFEQNKTKTR